MIGCDECENWFHPKCLEKLGIDISQITNIADFPFSCKECNKKKEQAAAELQKQKQEKKKEKHRKLVKELKQKENLRHKKQMNEEVIKAIDSGISE